MSRFSQLTDREVRKLRDTTERERMEAHYAHNEDRRMAAKKKLGEIDKEIDRRRAINRENRRRTP